MSHNIVISIIENVICVSILIAGIGKFYSLKYENANFIYFDLISNNVD